MLRAQANSGSIDDLAHVVSKDCLSDSLTKHSAKPDDLIKAVETGVLKNVDLHPPFRSLLKHKAFFAMWALNFLEKPRQILTVLGEDLSEEISYAYATCK